MGSRAEPPRPARSRCLLGCSASSAATRAPGQRVAERLGADRRRRSAPASQQVVRVTAGLDPAHARRSGSRPARGPRATCASATARTAGPDTPPVPPPSHGSPGRRGCKRHAAQRVDQRDGVGAVRLGGGGDVGRRRAVRRQLDDQRLGACSGRTASSSARRLARVGAHDQPGLDVRAGDVELERGDLVALGERRDERRDLARGVKPMTLTISGTGSSASCGQVLREVAVAGPCSAARSS